MKGDAPVAATYRIAMANNAKAPAWTSAGVRANRMMLPLNQDAGTKCAAAAKIRTHRNTGVVLSKEYRGDPIWRRMARAAPTFAARKKIHPRSTKWKVSNPAPICPARLGDTGALL